MNLRTLKKRAQSLRKTLVPNDAEKIIKMMNEGKDQPEIQTAIKNAKKNFELKAALFEDLTNCSSSDASCYENFFGKCEKQKSNDKETIDAAINFVKSLKTKFRTKENSQPVFSRLKKLFAATVQKKLDEQFQEVFSAPAPVASTPVVETKKQKKEKPQKEEPKKKEQKIKKEDEKKEPEKKQVKKEEEKKQKLEIDEDKQPKKEQDKKIENKEEENKEKEKKEEEKKNDKRDPKPGSDSGSGTSNKPQHPVLINSETIRNEYWAIKEKLPVPERFKKAIEKSAEFDEKDRRPTGHLHEHEAAAKLMQEIKKHNNENFKIAIGLSVAGLVIPIISHIIIWAIYFSTRQEFAEVVVDENRYFAYKSINSWNDLQNKLDAKETLKEKKAETEEDASRDSEKERQLVFRKIYSENTPKDSGAKSKDTNGNALKTMSIFFLDKKRAQRCAEKIRKFDELHPADDPAFIKVL